MSEEAASRTPAAASRAVRRTALLAGAVGGLAAALLVAQVEERRYQERRQAADRVIDGLESRARAAVAGALSGLDLLAAGSRDGWSPESLAAVAAALPPSHPGVGGVVTTGDGAVVQTWPAELAAPLAESRLLDSAIAAYDETAGIGWAGPRTLRRGQMAALAIRRPSGPDHGFVGVVLLPGAILKETEGGGDGDAQLVLGARGERPGFETRSFETAGLPWRASVVQVARFPSRERLAFGALCSLLAALGIALATRAALREPERLRSEMDKGRRRQSKALQELEAQVVERERAEEKLHHETTHDPLTGLASRAHFTARLQWALEFGRDFEAFQVAVLFVDLDRFKFVNDGLGLSVGDKFLSLVAQRLRDNLRSVDAMARVGGDEFAILLAGIPEGDVGTVAEHVLELMRSPLVVEGAEVRVTGSIGIAHAAKGALDGPQLMENAELALRKAKADGRDRKVFFEEGMLKKVSGRVHLETDLRKAVERDEFFVVYEPVVSLKTGKLAGFESLVRWKHPVRGMVSPGEFIPLAEETGLIVFIDRGVMAAAFDQVKDWNDRYPREKPLFMSINLSGADLTQPRLVGHVKEVLEKSGANPASVKMELTESSVVDNAASALEILEGLRGLGLGLSMDDFGTGYASFSYIRQFPFTTVKVDRSFVVGVSTSAKDREVVRTITDLAHSLGMEVVAEGPDLAHLPVLRELGCDYAQGWCFSKPKIAAESEALIQSDPTW